MKNDQESSAQRQQPNQDNPWDVGTVNAGGGKCEHGAIVEDSRLLPLLLAKEERISDIGQMQ